MTTEKTMLLVNGEELKMFLREVVDEALQEAKNIKQPEKYLSEKEVCQSCKVTHSTLWRWAKTGYLKPVKFGRRNMWLESDITKLMTKEEG